MPGRVAFRPVFHMTGMLLSVLGGAMLLPALVDATSGNPDWQSFVGASLLTLTASGGMVLASAGPKDRFGVKETFLLTTLSWVLVAGFGAVPFMISNLHLSLTDAYFESMSGLSTTGATVITGLDTAPPGLLLWRALLNWMGGIGIIGMAVAVLPVLRIGGMQLFRAESSERGDRPFATLADTALAIALTYLALSVLSAVLFHMAGMGWFDAICHAMAAVSTGGFSTKGASLGYYQSNAVLWAGTVSIVAGALPLTWYLRLTKGFRRSVLTDSQVVTFLAVCGVCVAAMTLWTVREVGLPFWDALAHSTLNVVSIIGDCGLVSTDYSTWGSFAVGAFFFFYFIGGCTGSSAGSIKIFRWQVLFIALDTQMKRMLQPHRVMTPLYQGKPLDEEILGSVANFVFAYLMCFILLTLALTAFGLDFLTSASGVASALAGAGPGLGPVIGPAGTYQTVPDAAKWLLTAAMLLGRLEVFTVLVVFTPGFWRY